MKQHNNNNIQLFIQPRGRLTTADEDLAQALAAKGYADLYTLRQRLQGEFPARLAHGDATQMEKLAQVLEQHQRPYRRISPPAPTFVPQELKELTLSGSQVTLHGSTSTIRCNPNTRLLAIVADISGKTTERHLKRKMVRHTYGVNASDGPDITTLEQDIFHLAPILDIYTLTASGNIDTGIRIIPGRFDHRQLGDAASLSRNKNLAALWQRIQASGAELKIHHGFDLGFIPECTPETVTQPNPYAQSDNLHALTQYAWFMAELEKNPGDSAEAEENHEDIEKKGTPTYASAPLLPSIFKLGTKMETSPAATKREQKARAAEHEHIDGNSNLPQPPDPTTLSGLNLYLQGRHSLLTLWMIIVAIIAGTSQTEMGVYILGYLFSVGAAQALLAGICFYFGIKYLLLKRRIEDTPTSKIRSMAMGAVEVQGRATRKYALVSPISGLPCVYYRIRKYRRKRSHSSRPLISSNNQSQWALVSISSSNNVPFLLDDGTGTLEVVPDGAKLKIRTTHAGSGSMAQLPFSTRSTQDSNARWEEEIIPDGSYIYILGFAHTYNAAPTHQDLLRQALNELKQDQERLHQFDRNGDGHIDASEWDQARRATANEVAHTQLRQSATTHTSVRARISKPPRSDYPFLIAETESELHLTRRFAYYSAILLATGLALALWGAYTAGENLHLF